MAPLVLSFDKKIAFYKKWKYLFPAMIIPALFYISWDIFFTAKGIWSFNENYVLGIKLVNLPLEEVLFFFVVPYCCVFIYECIRCYFPRLQQQRAADNFLLLLGATLLICGIIFYKQLYTTATFLLCGFFIAIIRLCRKFFKHFNAMTFLTSFIIILVPFLIVNGLLTSIPVVLYNDAENLGIRLYTIPFEDIFYGMLLVMMNVALFEKFREQPQV